MTYQKNSFKDLTMLTRRWYW